MGWIDRKEGWISRRENTRRRVSERVYSVTQVARMLNVSRNTVYKYLDSAIIPAEGWFKLPGGGIRIREAAVMRIKSGQV